MVQQIEITLKPKRRGFHLVTSEIVSQLPKLPKTGIVNIFTKHTSCGLSINENCDPDVRVDMETIFNRLVPENRPEYEHTLEGADDMPAHAKSTLSGVSITIPITDGRLNLGTWQGIYFCEFRNYGGSRELVITHRGDYGRIINISTDASQVFAGQIAYGASKATLEALTRSIALEVAKYGITVGASH